MSRSPQLTERGDLFTAAAVVVGGRHPRTDAAHAGIVLLRVTGTVASPHAACEMK
jgi:hypothetical protein